MGGSTKVEPFTIEEHPPFTNAQMIALERAVAGDNTVMENLYKRKGGTCPPDLPCAGE